MSDQLALGAAAPTNARPACCEKLLTTLGVGSPATCGCGRRWIVRDAEWQEVEIPGFGMPAPLPEEMPGRLAEALAWNLLNPTSFGSGSAGVLLDYRDQVGDLCPAIVLEAIERVGGAE